MIDTLPLGEIGGQHAPLDPPFGHIKDGIEYGPHTQGARSSTAFGGGDHIFDPLPFLVGQVAWIYFFVHLPILHNPRRLFRQALREPVRINPWPSPLISCGANCDGLMINSRTIYSSMPSVSMDT